LQLVCLIQQIRSRTQGSVICIRVIIIILFVQGRSRGTGDILRYIQVHGWLQFDAIHDGVRGILGKHGFHTQPQQVTAVKLVI
jgi:hypothetical protein